MLSQRSQALPLAGHSLALGSLIPFEAITLSPGQAHHAIAPVTSSTPLPIPPPMQQRRAATKTAACWRTEAIGMNGASVTCIMSLNMSIMSKHQLSKQASPKAKNLRKTENRTCKFVALDNKPIYRLRMKLFSAATAELTQCKVKLGPKWLCQIK